MNSNRQPISNWLVISSALLSAGALLVRWTAVTNEGLAGGTTAEWQHHIRIADNVLLICAVVFLAACALWLYDFSTKKNLVRSDRAPA